MAATQDQMMEWMLGRLRRGLVKGQFESFLFSNWRTSNEIYEILTRVYNVQAQATVSQYPYRPCSYSSTSTISSDHQIRVTCL